jgi:hypothetical protein
MAQTHFRVILEAVVYSMFICIKKSHCTWINYLVLFYN